MNRLSQFAFVSAVAFCGFSFLAGCNKGSSTDAATAPTATSADPSPSTDAVTQAAADFVDALIKGDAARASARFTPQAMQQTANSGIKFAPPGWANTTFRMGEVRSRSVNEAVVHCVLIVNSTATPHNEEMCCVMRLVDNDWRVAGIAYWDNKNPGGTLQDFETGQRVPIPRNLSAPNPASPSPSPPPGTQTLPPRIAQEPGATSPF
ncbi:MAG: hypothetical protein L0228_14210 [Planctomycetes bacterium]|nr:hypothetical protein [Planctomycetota bacterium]